jgi:hypothetical protein
MLALRLGVREMQGKLRVSGGDLVTMAIVGAIMSVLALVFAGPIRGSDTPFAAPTSRQPSMTAPFDQ